MGITMLNSEHARIYSRVILIMTVLAVFLLLYKTGSARLLTQYGVTNVVLIALTEQNSSGQSGWARLTATGIDTEVTLSLSSSDIVTDIIDIHEGQCGSGVGTFAYDLTDLSRGASTTLLEDVSLESLLTGDFTIIAHHIEDSSLHTAIHTACGNLPSNSDTVTIRLDQLNASAQFGWATLTDRGNDTEVVVSLSTGNMVSKFIHIHSGRCGASLGGVVYGLTDFADGVSVALVRDVPLSNLLTGGFAINAHNITFPAVYTACGDIPAQTNIATGSVSNFSSLEGGVTVHVPAAAPTGVGSLRYSPKTTVDFPSLPNGLNYGNTLFELTILDPSGSRIHDYRFATTIAITVKYTEDDVLVAGGNPADLVLQKYDTAFQRWTALGTTFNPAAKTVTAKVSSLSLFAFIGSGLPRIPDPTSVATSIPATATATLLLPTPGDVVPGFGLLIGMLIAAATLVAAGAYYLGKSRSP